MGDDLEKHREPKRVQAENPAIGRALTDYDAAVDVIKAAEARKKAALEDLVQLCNGKDTDYNGRKITLVKRAGNVNYRKALEKIAPFADLEPYRQKPSEFWKVT